MAKWQKRQRRERDKTKSLQAGDWQSLRDASVAARFGPPPPPAFQKLVVKPATRNQLVYLETVRDHVLTFCSGPSGVGKTLLACWLASEYLDKGIFSKIVLCRPLVECGMTMGFQKGSAEEKIAPFAKPALDKMGKFYGAADITRMRESGVLEVASVNFLRGDEFQDAFVILDEAQNLNECEMKMFCTRIGKNCKVVINGDADQIDIPDPSGLTRALAKLPESRLIGFCRMGPEDVMRSQVTREFLANW